MRVALCQINPTVGDLAGNCQRISQAAARAAEAGTRLAVFPELAICGYPPRDLLDRRGFVEASQARLDALAGELPAELACLVGFVDAVAGARRMRFFNAAALLRGGSIQQVFHKQLLPTYDVFDEARYFEVGDAPAVVDIDGVRVGVTICEDLWNDVESPMAVPYARNPVATCVEGGAQLLVNLSASPFTLAKRGFRARMMADVARKHGRPLVFVNQVGGNDDLIFDGASTLFGGDGEVRARARSFAEDVVVADLASGGQVHPLCRSNEDAALEALTLGVRDYARKCGFEQAVIGLSGGIDSALTACIAVRALGAKNVLTVAMPTRYSSQGSLDDARSLADALGVHHRVIEIDGVFQSYRDVLGAPLDELRPAPPKDTTYENLQARIRGATLMAISNRTGRLLLSTGNKSELAVGYCTLYGDMAGGLAVISDLPKLFVYRVSRAFNADSGNEIIPESVLTKPPSAELAPDQKDEDSLPPYSQLDPIIERYVEDGASREELIEEGFDAATVNRVVSMIWTNEYKRRQMPPGLIITHKAFGPGRRYPIAQRYRD